MNEEGPNKRGSTLSQRAKENPLGPDWWKLWRAAAEERKNKSATPETNESNVEQPPEPESFETRLDAVGDELHDLETLEFRSDHNEDTTAGWKKRLHDLINGAGEKIGEVKEKVIGLFEKKKDYLAMRSAELGTRVGNYDPTVEKLFRSMGEKYNKLGWKSKLGVGLGLGLGAAAFSGVSMPIVFGCMSGIAAQRIAGMAGIFLRFEKNNKNQNQPESDKFWKIGPKEIAMLKAAGYSLGMSYGIGKAVQFVGDSEYGQAIHEWLKHHWPFGSAAQPLSYEAHNAPPLPDVSAISEIPAIEIPDVSVDASPGHGYEWMMKRLWEQLHGQNTAIPADLDPGSDLARLLEADATTIDKVVHQIASDSNHSFFNADGTSVQINPGEQMTIGDDFQIHLNEAVNAPEGAPITPAYNPAVEAPVAPQPEAPIAPQIDASGLIQPEEFAKEINVKTPVAPATHEPVVQADTRPIAGTRVETTIERAPTIENPTVPISHPDDLSTPQAEIQPDITYSSEGATVGRIVPGSSEPVIEYYGSSTESYDTSPVVSRGIDVSVGPELQQSIISNSGLVVPLNEPHIYEMKNATGEIYRAVLGGSDEAQFKFAQDFLSDPKNQGIPIRFSHNVSSILGSHIKVDELGAQTDSGRTSWFANFFAKPIEMLDPKNASKIIK